MVQEQNTKKIDQAHTNCKN